MKTQMKCKSAPVKVRAGLKTGDKVMVIAGGNKTNRANKGKVGKIVGFSGIDRVIVEGINIVTKHVRARSAQQQSARVQREAPVHISHVLFYVEKLKKPVRIKINVLADGTRVRGYKHPETGKFEQIA
jgi:large subunit ribosomal protein L24